MIISKKKNVSTCSVYFLPLYCFEQCVALIDQMLVFETLIQLVDQPML